jgi:hypothetical protein
MANLKFIPNAVSKSSGGVQLSLEDIQADVRQEVEEVYETLKTNPGRMHAEFATLAELNTYIAQVTAYCALRPAGEIRFRKSPARGLKPTEMHFRITEKQTPNEKVTEEIQTATEAVKTSAKK